MNNSSDKGHVTETPDVSYIKNVDVSHETDDVQIGGIVRFALALFVLLVVSCLLMWAMFHMLASRAKEPERSPMALSDHERLPPEPRLQGAPGFGERLKTNATPEISEQQGPAIRARQAEVPKDPLWEINEVRKRWSDTLKNGPVDQNGQRYGMPIEKAKEEILKQGLPVRGQKAESSKQ
jgi:hypothetical protein